MRKLIKFHFCYLFNKRTIILLILSLILSSISFYTNLTTSKFLTIQEEIDIYFSSSLILNKIIISLFNIFLYVIILNRDNDFYIYYFDSYRRGYYIASKLLLLLIVSFTIFIILFSLFLIIGFLGNQYFYFQFKFLKSFFEVYLISVINGLYGMFLMQLFNNNFVIFIPFLFVIFSDNLFDHLGNLVYFLALFIPSNFYGPIYLLWLICILNILNHIIYCIRDINY